MHLTPTVPAILLIALLSSQAGSGVLHAQPPHRVEKARLELVTDRVEGQNIHATVILGGVLKSHKGINLPGTDLNIPGFTEKDEEDLLFGLKIGIDAVAVSFVRTPDDIARVKRAINPGLPCFCSVSHHSAWQSADPCIAAAIRM